ncbi:hypothetical protein JCM11641_003829 [Rhodosporidiobolus odoratus]
MSGLFSNPRRSSSATTSTSRPTSSYISAAPEARAMPQAFEPAFEKRWVHVEKAVNNGKTKVKRAVLDVHQRMSLRSRSAVPLESLKETLKVNTDALASNRVKMFLGDQVKYKKTFDDTLTNARCRARLYRDEEAFAGNAADNWETTIAGYNHPSSGEEAHRLKRDAELIGAMAQAEHAEHMKLAELYTDLVQALLGSTPLIELVAEKKWGSWPVSSPAVRPTSSAGAQ